MQRWVPDKHVAYNRQKAMTRKLCNADPPGGKEQWFEIVQGNVFNRKKTDLHAES